MHWRTWVMLPAALIITGWTAFAPLVDAQTPRRNRLIQGQNIRLKCIDNPDQPWYLHGSEEDSGVRITQSTEITPNTVFRVVLEKKGVRLALLIDPKKPRWLDGWTNEGWVKVPTDNRGSGSYWEFVPVGDTAYEIKCLGHIEGRRWLVAEPQHKWAVLHKKVDRLTVSRWEVEVVKGPVKAD